MRSLSFVLALLIVGTSSFDASSLSAQRKPRENDLKLPIGGTPGALNAITDVAGVEVGHSTIISGSGALVVGQGPVRTGVTIVHPRGKANHDPVFASWFALNGNGEMTGTTWVQESGFLEGPIAITNTHSVGVVRDAIIKWEVSQKNVLQPWWLPVVAETYDGGLNDINGFHVKESHAFAALNSAAGGLPAEGVVGGGTGMRCLESFVHMCAMGMFDNKEINILTLDTDQENGNLKRVWDLIDLYNRIKNPTGSDADAGGKPSSNTFFSAKLILSKYWPSYSGGVNYQSLSNVSIQSDETKENIDLASLFLDSAAQTCKKCEKQRKWSSPSRKGFT